MTNETISKEIKNYYPVFYNASAETLGNALQHMDRKRLFVVHEHILFFTIYVWKQDIFSLDHFNI